MPPRRSARASTPAPKAAPGRSIPPRRVAGALCVGGASCATAELGPAHRGRRLEHDHPAPIRTFQTYRRGRRDTVTEVQAIFIAILQGLTELFPVSSLGHAVVLPRLLGWD